MRTSILVAESDPEFSAVVIETFSSGEYSVRAVSTLDDAIAEIERETPDVVVLSEELSEGKGQEICQRLREKKGQAEVPALILLTCESKSHQILAFNSWADACLHRPVDPVILESTVESVVQRRRKQAPANPLTKLPGPTALSKEMGRRMAAGEEFSARTFRLDTLQASAYRRKYGELKFLTMVKLAAHTIASCALVHGGKEAFVAHRGTSENPEFVVLIEANKAEGFAKATCEDFAGGSELLYDKRDRMEGQLVEIDETGKRTSIPFVSMAAEAMSEEKVAHR
ncbi:MAG: response regulator [Candidatus Eisenbacteria bacterium]|nr:response regulator [Candidatus Eisenbacteria bacterium]